MLPQLLSLPPPLLLPQLPLLAFLLTLTLSNYGEDATAVISKLRSETGIEGGELRTEQLEDALRREALAKGAEAAAVRAEATARDLGEVARKREGGAKLELEKERRERC